MYKIYKYKDSIFFITGIFINYQNTCNQNLGNLNISGASESNNIDNI